MSNEYVARINRVLDFIDRNIARELTLDELADVANFSPYHFHRIFSGMTGETVSRFIGRLRIERAATKLCIDPDLSVTDIALDLGYSSSAVFARVFKERFGCSATEWRSRKCGSNDINDLRSKNRKTFRNFSEEAKTPFFYFDIVNSIPTWRMKMKKDGETFDNVTVEVKEIEPMSVAYVRYVGPYMGDDALFERLFGKLCQWAGPRGLMSGPDMKFMTFYHDDPEITDDEKLRISVAMQVPKDTRAEGEIGRMDIEATTCAVAEFKVLKDEYSKAWQTVYGKWLPESGYQPADGLPYELFLNDPSKDPEGKHHFAIHVPLKKL